jgi:hypothetical protein
MLLGRPWLYKAKVKTDWHKKTFTFGKPKTTISWETIIHEGETSSSDRGYTSKESAISDDSSLINMVKALDESTLFWEEEDKQTRPSNMVLSLPQEEENLDISSMFEVGEETLDLSEVQNSPEEYNNALEPELQKALETVVEKDEEPIGSK